MKTCALLFSALFVSSFVACQKPSAPAAPPATYEVSGELLRLPTPGKTEVLIRHEAIPGFRDEAGKEVGMDAMTMPFPLASGVSVEGLTVGDKVSFTLETRWELDREPVRITRIARAENRDVIHEMDLEDGKVPGQSVQKEVETPK